MMSSLCAGSVQFSESGNWSQSLGRWCPRHSQHVFWESRDLYSSCSVRFAVMPASFKLYNPANSKVKAKVKAKQRSKQSIIFRVHSSTIPGSHFLLNCALSRGRVWAPFVWRVWRTLTSQGLTRSPWAIETEDIDLEKIGERTPRAQARKYSPAPRYGMASTFGLLRGLAIFLESRITWESRKRKRVRPNPLIGRSMDHSWHVLLLSLQTYVCSFVFLAPLLHWSHDRFRAWTKSTPQKNRLRISGLGSFSEGSLIN